jgi:hypothetical protein
MGPVSSLRSDEREPAVHPSEHQRQPNQRTWLYAADEARVLKHRDCTR